MGVYIKGMKMPKGLEMLVVFSDGTVHKCLPGMREHIEKGTAVPVPAHGRLINADALIEHLEFTMKHCTIEGHTAQRYREMIVELCIAPTIIPAEKEGE